MSKVISQLLRVWFWFYDTQLKTDLRMLNCILSEFQMFQNMLVMCFVSVHYRRLCQLNPADFYRSFFFLFFAIFFRYNHYLGFLFNLDREPALKSAVFISRCNPSDTQRTFFFVLVRLLSRLLVHGRPSLQMMTSFCQGLSGVSLMICLTDLSVSTETC